MPSYSGIFTLPAQMQAKAIKNWPDPSVPSVIGQSIGGGYYAGQIGVAGTATHYIIVAPLSSGQTQLTWKNAASGTVGADSVIDGPQNTADMVADGSSTVYPAAHFCNDAVIGGFSDWYMPAKNELEVCYYNLKPTTTGNSTSSGTNTNAVPSRGSNYTEGTPAQTSAVAFKIGGAEPFTVASYWSSTEFSGGYSWFQSFSNGNQYQSVKYNSLRVRAIRRIPV